LWQSAYKLSELTMYSEIYVKSYLSFPSIIILVNPGLTACLKLWYASNHHTSNSKLHACLNLTEFDKIKVHHDLEKTTFLNFNKITVPSIRHDFVKLIVIPNMVTAALYQDTTLVAITMSSWKDI
jgi:hypothetical protein